MATNEPVTNDMLTDDEREIITEEYIRNVKRELAKALAEIAYLRAREQALAAENESLADRLELLRSALSQEEAENAAMRPIVEAVSEASVGRSTIPWIRPDGRPTRLLADWGYVPAEFREQARAFIGAHPATVTAAGEVESEEE